MKQLLDIARTLAQTTDVESLARPLLTLLQQYTGLESAYLTLIDTKTDAQTVLFAHNTGTLDVPERISVPWGDSLCRRAIEDEQPIIESVQDQYGHEPLIAQLGIESFVSVPVRVNNEYVYGTLFAASCNQVTISEDDYALMTLFATLIGRQFQREAHLRAAQDKALGLEQQMAEMQLLSRVGQVCWVAESLQPALSTCADLLSRFGQWCKGAYYHAGSAGGPLDSSEVVRLLESIPQWENAADTPWHHAAVLQVSQLPDSLLPSLNNYLSGELASVAVVRVENDLGLAGLIVLLSHEPLNAPGTQGQDTLLVGEACGQYLSLLASRLHQQDQLQQLNQELATEARRDPLTGLNNRRVLMSELERQLKVSARSQAPFSLAFIDLDGFKSINDHYGHKAGDMFLEAFAARLTHLCRGSDLPARIGGDEFVLLMPMDSGSKVPNLKALTTNLRNRMTASLSGEFDLGEFGVIDYQGPSIGIVHYEPGMTDAEAFLSLADEAMYVEKRRRKAQRQSK